MLQPVQSAIECFLIIYNSLPFAVRAFVDLSLAFSLLAGLRNILRLG